MIRIAFISDIHGYLINIPECDVLVIAGDIVPRGMHDIHKQMAWLNSDFRDWLDAQPVKRAVACWGNHDFIGEIAPHLVPTDIKCKFYTDNWCEIDGIVFYFSPWQRRFYDWAFNLDEPDLDKKYNQIPDCHILVTHGPPYGYGDTTIAHDEGSVPEQVGSKSLLKKIDEIQPLVAVNGHIHSGRGLRLRGKTIVVNASLVNERYTPMNKPFVFDISEDLSIKLIDG